MKIPGAIFHTGVYCGTVFSTALELSTLNELFHPRCKSGKFTEKGRSTIQSFISNADG